MTMKAAREPGTGREPSMTKPQPDSRERLAEALQAEKLPKRCNLHPRACWYDGPECPCCSAEKNFLALTKNMEDN